MLHQAADQAVLLGLQELIHQGSGDLPELLLQGGHLALPRRCAELGVVLDLRFGAACPQRGHDAVLQREGDHVTAPGHGKNRSEVRLAAVVSRGNVSYMNDLDAAARLRVRAAAVKVSDAAEDPLDGGRVVTDDVGGFRHVIPVRLVDVVQLLDQT